MGIYICHYSLDCIVKLKSVHCIITKLYLYFKMPKCSLDKQQQKMIVMSPNSRVSPFKVFKPGQILFL